MRKRSAYDIAEESFSMEIEGVDVRIYPPVGESYGARKSARWDPEVLSIAGEGAVYVLGDCSRSLTALSPTARETLLDIIYARWGS